MLANKVMNLANKNNTIIIVEQLLLRNGVNSILENYGIHAQNKYIDEIITTEDESSVYVCAVKKELIEQEVTKLFENDITSKIIILMDTLDYQTIKDYLEMGIKSVLLSNLDHEYLVVAVKEVIKGNSFIDSQFTDYILEELKAEKTKEVQITSVNDCPLRALLTKKEFEVLLILAEGLSNTEIAEKLGIMPSTVKNHISSILEKLYVPDRLAAVVKCVKNNWIEIK